MKEPDDNLGIYATSLTLECFGNFMINAIDFSKWNDLTQKKDLSRSTWLSTGEVIFLKGKYKVGKSLFVQQLMTSVSTGHSWFDEDVGKIKTYGIFCEDDETHLCHRQCKINKFYQLRSSDLVNSMRLVPKTDRSALMIFDNYSTGHITSYFDKLLEDIILFQPKFVVLDEVSQLFWGDTNNEYYLYQFIQGCCARIAKIANCTVLVCEHDTGAKIYHDRVWYLSKSDKTSCERILRCERSSHLLRYQDNVFII